MYLLIRNCLQSIYSLPALILIFYILNKIVPVSIDSEKADEIERVIEKFSIDTSSASSISFSKDLPDRGLARVGTTLFITRCYVLLGPEAFVSEEVLASTLAHEVEIHCKQGFKRYYLSVKELEKEAYDHEIKNQNRFKTTDSYVSEIKETYNFYYGEENEDNY